MNHYTDCWLAETWERVKGVARYDIRTSCLIYLGEDRQLHNIKRNDPEKFEEFVCPLLSDLSDKEILELSFPKNYQVWTVKTPSGNGVFAVE